MLTVYFEDHGQDFLEWDIEGPPPGEKDAVVVGCRPFQEWLWNGTKVHSTDFEPGLLLDITTTHGERTRLRYPVESVKQDASV